MGELFPDATCLRCGVCGTLAQAVKMPELVAYQITAGRCVHRQKVIPVGRPADQIRFIKDRMAAMVEG